ncbi:MAG: hypothetical protein ACRDK7_10760 [Solirubrobacteraceae bacterium]
MIVRAKPLLVFAVAFCALALGGCGNTIQDQPISHATLENLLLAPFPVYWLGGSFQRMAITAASEDPSGAFTIQYGDCAAGGQNSCIARLRIVTSPDNSFVPSGSQPHRAIVLRGVTGVAAQGGETISLPTAGVVVGVYADSPGLARDAAETAVPINDVGASAAPLPAPLPNTGFGERPLPDQAPTLLRAPN